MTDATLTVREFHLPVASVHALRGALETEVGADASARALQAAGHAAGDAIYAALAAEAAPAGGALHEIEQAEFWGRLGDFFYARGWGRLHFEAVHPGIGALESADWAEADPGAGALRPSCHFTSGLIANLLGRTANQDVGALEVECRSRGDLHCRFLFGGQPALERVYDALRRGRDIDGALAEFL